MKVERVINFIKKHKVLTIITALIVIIGFARIKDNIYRSILTNRDYSLSIDEGDNYAFECNTIDGHKCQSRIISGSYSKFNGVGVFADYYECSMDNNNYECEINTSLSDLYETYNIDIKNIPDEYISTIDISVKERENIFADNLASKKITIKYTISESDKNVIVSASEKWQKHQEEEKAKAEAEKAKKKEEEAKKKEEEAIRKAEAKKKEEESKKLACQKKVSKFKPVEGEFHNFYDDFRVRVTNLAIECDEYPEWDYYTATLEITGLDSGTEWHPNSYTLKNSLLSSTIAQYDSEHYSIKSPTLPADLPRKECVGINNGDNFGDIVLKENQTVRSAICGWVRSDVKKVIYSYHEYYSFSGMSDTLDLTLLTK